MGASADGASNGDGGLGNTEKQVLHFADLSFRIAWYADELGSVDNDKNFPKTRRRLMVSSDGPCRYHSVT